MNRKAVTVAGLAVIASGCIAIREGTEARCPVVASPADPRRTVSVVITARARDEDIALEGTPGAVGSAYAAWAARVEEAFRESRLFRTVTVGLHPADLRARVVITRHQSLNQTALRLTGLTLWVVPLTWPIRYTVDLSVAGGDGRERTFSSSEAQRAWMQLLLLPVQPFAGPRQAGEGAVLALTLDALAQAQRAGAI